METAKKDNFLDLKMCETLKMELEAAFKLPDDNYIELTPQEVITRNPSAQALLKNSDSSVKLD